MEPEDICAQRVGQVIKGKWTIDALLGVGGMAAVYAATHRNGQRAALKILHIDFAKDKTVFDRFLREAYVSNKINHPACVSVLDDDVTDQDEPFLVMELLDGETLRELWMNTGRRVPVDTVLKIADPVLDCLAACHAIGVIHRDLKPANIFVCKSGQVKVLDFGVAQFRSATAERTATGTALGTPSYMSPEQAMGLVDQLDGRADVFSMGAVIHALVTGHRINKGRTENEALVMAATTPVPSVARIAPDLPVEVIALIDKALAWDRRNRFESARAMQTAVRAALGITSAVQQVQVASPAPVSAPESPKAAPKTEEEAPPDDARVVTMRDLFKRIDRVLPSVRQMGWDHPATERALRIAFEGFAEALKANARAVDLWVRPYSLLMLNQTVWEPGPPFDAVPYNLFSAGIRRLRARPGITLEELRELLALMLLEPGRDLAPEDDLAAAFWEKNLAHVEYDVVDAFAEGGASEREAFYSESDQMERIAGAAARQHVSRLEAKAMAVSTDRNALKEKKKTSPMALDDVVRAVLASQLEQARDRWSERFVDVLVEGLIDAAKARDAQPVLASLRKSAADLVVAGRVDVVTQLHRALLDRVAERLPQTPASQLSAALTNALFGAETLELMLRRLPEEPSRINSFQPVLGSLSQKELPTVLASLKTSMPPEMEDALLSYVERVLPGKEMEVAAAAAGMPPAVACKIVQLLARANARVALQSLEKSDDPTVRIEAKVLLCGAETIQAELGALCEDPSALVRMAALRATARHSIKKMFPVVSRRVRQPDFHQLGSDERRELLTAMLTLSLEHGEPIALELARKGGVFVSEEKEASRVAAIEALGACSRSREVAQALREVATSRWGTSEDTKQAASAAADQIQQRAASVS
jgi:serine/threonine protein kinase